MELLDQLMINIVGNSSLLYVWDEREARLIPRVNSNGARLLVIVDGLDETSSTGYKVFNCYALFSLFKKTIISSRVIQRFLNVGTLVRRLENLIQSLRER